MLFVPLRQFAENRSVLFPICHIFKLRVGLKTVPLKIDALIFRQINRRKAKTSAQQCRVLQTKSMQCTWARINFEIWNRPYYFSSKLSVKSWLLLQRHQELKYLHHNFEPHVCPWFHPSIFITLQYSQGQI